MGFLRWALVIFVGILTLAAIFYVFVMKPSLEVEKNAPIEISKSVEAFQQCWGVKNLEVCRPLMTDLMANSISSFFSGDDPIGNKLGKRLSGELRPETIKIRTDASVTGKGRSTVVSVVYKAIYEKDINVSEYYAFVTQGKPGDYRIHAFKVNSPEFGK